MDFLNKITNAAKSMTNKGGDIIEINKLNSKISVNMNTIDELSMKLGKHCMEQFEAGAEMDQTAMGLCTAIRSCKCEIDELEKQIAAIKTAENQPPAEEPAFDPGQQYAESVPYETAVIECPVCGMQSRAGTKTCPACGADLSSIR